MRALDCNVVNCEYNGNNRCMKDDVHVEGRNATESRETCCGSFRQKSDCCKNVDKNHCCK